MSHWQVWLLFYQSRWYIESLLDVWSSWSRSRVAASAARSPLSHAGGVQPGSSSLLLLACAGASYGYTIWCTTLVQLVTFGAACCLLLFYFCFTSLCSWCKWHQCLVAWLQLGWWGSRYGFAQFAPWHSYHRPVGHFWDGWVTPAMDADGTRRSRHVATIWWTLHNTHDSNGRYYWANWSH